MTTRRVRRQTYLDPPVAHRLRNFCAASAITESAAMQAAICQYLDGTSDRALLLRRLDRLDRALVRAQRDVEIFQEAFATWLKLWFAHTPSVPEDAKNTARAHGQRRYKQFVEHLSQQLSRGGRFVDDLPKEPLADEDELATAAATPIGAGNADAPIDPAPKRRGAP